MIDKTLGSNHTFLMGATTSSRTVTERSTLQMLAIYSCISILAEAVVGLQLHLYRYRG
ncbi:hypothetical protein [Carnobacterium sp. 17-4]|uniref:hypothetical protein n=1 Tax=Carnobacterium sp. (strain 17-4) TaxID=208596 RepID=UPI0013050CA1|nr:hypothetical protein [Carnobacterium sp. 17-4]